MIDREAETFVWDTLCAVSDAYGGDLSPLMLLGTMKSKHISAARAIFADIVREHLYWDGFGFVVIFGEKPEGYRPISYPQMSAILGHHHTTWIALRQRYDRMKGAFAHVAERAEQELATKWSIPG